MGAVGGSITFVLIWWLVLFCVLPLKAKGVWEEPDQHAKGVDRGAPVNPELWWKIKRTTFITIPIWILVFLIVSSGVFDPGR